MPLRILWDKTTLDNGLNSQTSQNRDENKKHCLELAEITNSWIKHTETYDTQMTEYEI